MLQLFTDHWVHPSALSFLSHRKKTQWQVKVVQSRQQSRQQAEGTEVHRGLVIRWNCCSILSIKEEVGKESEVGGLCAPSPSQHFFRWRWRMGRSTGLKENIK